MDKFGNWTSRSRSCWGCAQVFSVSRRRLSC